MHLEFTPISSALQGDVLEEFDSHFTGGPWTLGILFHQDTMGVVGVQGVHSPMRQVLCGVGCWLIWLEKNNFPFNHENVLGKEYMK